LPDRNTPLLNGVVDRGFVSVGSWNYYNYQTNSVANLAISIRQTSALADCDLFAKAGQNPTRTSYDAAEVSVAQNFTMTIQDPGRLVWYIGVYGWTSCEYTIAVLETTSCPSNCNGHGSCGSNGQCLCDPNWSGDACDQQMNQLQNNVVKLQEQLESVGSWNYYSFTAVNTSSVHFVVKETASSGWLWMFVSRDTPTLRNYLFSDTETNTNKHRITIDLNQEQSVSFQLGVYANPYTLDDHAVTYDVIAWSPDF